MLWGLIEFVREIAVIAAAVGVAKWAWDQHVEAPARRDETARVLMARERESADLRADVRQLGSRLEALAVDISTRLDEVLERQRDAEQRQALKLAVHRVLHATKDPFLSFEEIRKTVRAPADAADGSSNGQQEPAEAELRRALLELVADGVLAQLEGDRYFVATDYDADDEA